MDPVSREVFELISAMGIGYRFVQHPPVRNMEDCKASEEALGAVMPKNLFLCTRNESDFFLLLTRPDAKYRTADISKQLGVSRLSFGSSEKLYEYLQTLPGAISPMGLLFDEEHKMKLAVDSALRDAPVLAFHPCVNTMSLSMTSEDFFGVFLPTLGYEPTFVEIHDFMGEEDEK